MLEQKLQRKNHQQVVMARPKSNAFLYLSLLERPVTIQQPAVPMTVGLPQVNAGT